VQVAQGLRKPRELQPRLGLRHRAVLDEPVKELAALHQLQHEGDLLLRFVRALVVHDVTVVSEVL
jgi:hypothetical protein